MQQPETAQTEATTSTGAIEIMAWFEVNKKKLLIAAVAALVVIIILVIYSWAMNEREVGASESLTELRLPLGAFAKAAPVPAEKFKKLAEEHSGTAAGPRALMLAGSTLFTEGKYAESQAAFDRFIRDYPNHMLLSQASFGVAAALDAQNKPEAATKYQEVVSRYSTDSSVVVPARLALARLNENAQKYKEAFTQYQELLRADSYGSWAEEAMARMRQLEKDHPEAAVVPPQPAAASMTNQPAIKVTTPGAPKAATPAPKTIKLTPPAQPAPSK